MKIHKNFNIGNYTTLKIPTICHLFIEIDCINELENFIKIVKIFNVKYLIIGNGSKLLFLNEFYNGIVIKLSNEFNKFEIYNNYIFAFSNVSLNKLISICLNEGFDEIYKLSMIPSTIGGAIVNNCGAYKCEIKDFIEQVLVIDDKGKYILINKEKANFSYRNSIFKEKKYIIIGALMHFKSNNQNYIKEEQLKIINKRIKTQPIKSRTCGSLFKNPKNLFAYKLIEESFDINFNYNGAHISNLHHNFLICENDCKAKDVFKLINAIKTSVYNKFSINLEEEIIIVK